MLKDFSLHKYLNASELRIQNANSVKSVVLLFTLNRTLFFENEQRTTKFNSKVFYIFRNSFLLSFFVSYVNVLVLMSTRHFFSSFCLMQPNRTKLDGMSDIRMFQIIHESVLYTFFSFVHSRLDVFRLHCNHHFSLPFSQRKGRKYCPSTISRDTVLQDSNEHLG